jgi:type IV secretion system protein VirD4
MKSNKAVFTLLTLLSIVLFYNVNRYAVLFSAAEGPIDIVMRVNLAFKNLTPSLLSQPFYISFSSFPFMGGLIAVGLTWAFASQGLFNENPEVIGKEHGSAKWGSPKDIKPFIHSDPVQNIILTETERLSITETMKRTKLDDFNRNNNILCVGGSGTGKSRFVIKPQLLQMYGSYVITDPKGILFHECGKMLQDNGYTIKVFDLVNRVETDHYNPFNYIRSTDDILKLINNIISNTNPKGNSGGEPFWEKAETALLEAIFGFLFLEIDIEQRTMSTVMSILELGDEYVPIEEETPVLGVPKPSVEQELQSRPHTQLDLMFETLEARPDHFALKQYKIFKFAAEETARSILISVGVRLSAFNIETIRNIVDSDTINLEEIGSHKTALFVVMSDTDSSFNFLAAMLFQQLFDSLVFKADHNTEKGGKLDFPVMCLLDEFSNIGQIPNFHVLISTIRSRNMGALICLQGLSQLKTHYKDSWETIAGNCDAFLYLGGMEESTIRYISTLCGKQTISSRSHNETKGPNASYSVNTSLLGRDLLTPDEVATMKGRQCILKISRCYPFFSKKFVVESHPNYKYLADYDKSNWFDFKNISRHKD